MPRTIELPKDEGVIAVPDGRNDGAEEMIKRMAAILSILPSYMDKGAFATSLIVCANEVKKDCTINSFLIAAFNAARIALMPGGLMGLCYFIPRKGSINLEIGYRGYLELGYRSKFLKDAYADVVLREEAEDENLFRFEIIDNTAKIYHKPLLDRNTVDNASLRNEVVGAYACWHTSAGGSSCRWITRHQLNAVDSGSNVWKSNYYEMCRKSPIRLGAKDWRMTTNLAEALDLDYLSEMGYTQNRYDLIGHVTTTEDEATPFSLKGIESDG